MTHPLKNSLFFFLIIFTLLPISAKSLDTSFDQNAMRWLNSSGSTSALLKQNNLNSSKEFIFNQTPQATPTPSYPVPINDARFTESMILLAILSIIIVLLAIWINRKRINQP